MRIGNAFRKVAAQNTRDAIYDTVLEKGQALADWLWEHDAQLVTVVWGIRRIYKTLKEIWNVFANRKGGRNLSGCSIAQPA